MKPSTIKFLIIIVVALLILWQGQSYLQNKNAQDFSSIGNLAQVEANRDQVNKITIRAGEEDTLEITKPETDWMVDGTSADIFKVNQLLDLIDQPQAEVVAQNQDRYEELKITDELANTISFWEGGNPKVVFLVSSDNARLIRQQGKQNVYLLPSPLPLSTLVTTWQATPTPIPTQAEEITEE